MVYHLVSSLDDILSLGLHNVAKSRHAQTGRVNLGDFFISSSRKSRRRLSQEIRTWQGVG